MMKYFLGWELFYGDGRLALCELSAHIFYLNLTVRHFDKRSDNEEDQLAVSRTNKYEVISCGVAMFIWTMF